jgi:acetyltransferase-like isoleucine patch superfamily enzyme
MNDLTSTFRKACFHARTKPNNLIWGRLRKIYWQLQGMSIGKGTNAPSLLITWHHQVAVGKDCTLEEDIYFKYDGPYQPDRSIVIGDRVFIGRGCEFNIRQKITIGHNSLIASGCKFIDHDHGMNLEQPMIRQTEGIEKSIAIEDDVWLGFNTIVLKGVVIGKGSIVGAGSVVTRSIPSYEVWAGVPAKRIRDRK